MSYTPKQAGEHVEAIFAACAAVDCWGGSWWMSITPVSYQTYHLPTTNAMKAYVLFSNSTPMNRLRPYVSVLKKCHGSGGFNVQHCSRYFETIYLVGDFSDADNQEVLKGLEKLGVKIVPVASASELDGLLTPPPVNRY